jgi:hypothetical protein
MKQLDINITKAQLVSFSVELKEGKPEVHCTIALLTEGGKPITTYTIFTESWHTDKFELPIEAMPLIGDVARILEGVAVRHCRDSQLGLPAPSKKAAKAKPAEVVIEDIDDSPINLDDIPF